MNYYNWIAMVIGWIRKLWQFSGNEYWKKIGCIILAPNFGLGRSRLWEEDEGKNRSVNKTKRHSIGVKVNFYDVCAYYILFLPLFILLLLY